MVCTLGAPGSPPALMVVAMRVSQTEARAHRDVDRLCQIGAPEHDAGVDSPAGRSTSSTRRPLWMPTPTARVMRFEGSSGQRRALGAIVQVPNERRATRRSVSPGYRVQRRPVNAGFSIGLHARTLEFRCRRSPDADMRIDLLRRAAASCQTLGALGAAAAEAHVDGGRLSPRRHPAGPWRPWPGRPSVATVWVRIGRLCVPVRTVAVHDLHLRRAHHLGAAARRAVQASGDDGDAQLRRPGCRRRRCRR
jgi:hypothetical protein